MIAANSAMFRRLTEFAGRREYPVPDPDAPRWVHANPDADEVLKAAVLRSSMSFGRFRHLAWLEVAEQHYVATIGFDYEVDDPGFEPLEDIQGYDVCLLTELPVSPSVSAAEVYNVVAANSRTLDPEYSGHDNAQIMSLFPPVRVFASVDPISDELIWPIFLSISSEESRNGGSWIEGDLADRLSALAEANVERLPYKELCRSTLDLDPRSLFMSLYRCVEATYAHDKTTKLKQDLSIEHEWHKIAEALENAMSWRPLEASSLNVVLALAQADDLREICDCLHIRLLGDTNLASAAGKGIYQLRNRIVHYRPALAPVESEEIDWNRLCMALVSVARDVFHSAYSQDSVA
ncbi:hypothetical protein RZO50_14360 [Microbacterium sp. SSW1-59]|uniref:hypothetical protein n=1 Tax=Microbacterium xanthum TaxID=3079794 RepID=UPI002AD2C8C4|nr:hypothetical protein [Microbacterium sp. SSW1-59]MDZ8202701.1 hypothetical protein [Microbacterium sp. SSW1-59]